MSEFRELAEETQKTGFPNWYQRIKQDLTEQQLSDLDDALNDRDIQPKVIMTVMERWGYTVSHNQISRERQRRGV